MPAIDRVVVDRAPWATRIAFLALGEVLEVWIEGTDRPSPLGGIALARVTGVHPELGSATVAIPGGEARVTDGRPVEGGRLVVQVVRDGGAAKRPRARAAVELSQGAVVLTPHAPGIGMSSSIGGKARRASVKTALALVVPDDLGVLVRAAGGNLPTEAIIADADALVRRWHSIVERAATAEPPAWIEPPVSIVDAARAHAGGIEPEIDETGRLFDECGAGDALDVGVARRVPLPGGGELVVDVTEAAALIDVNLPAGGGPEGFRRANVTAGLEALRQARLRGLRGTLLLDLPRMADRPTRDHVFDRLAEAAGADPTPTRLLGWTPGGMLEIVREGTRRPLAEELVDERGEPQVSARAAAWAALSGLRREAVRIARPRLAVSAQVAGWLQGPGRPIFEAERRRLGHLTLAADPALAREIYRVENDD